MDYVPKSLGDAKDLSTGNQSIGFHIRTFVIFGVLLVLVLWFVSQLANLTAKFIPDKYEVALFSEKESSKNDTEQKDDSDINEESSVMGELIDCRQFESFSKFEKQVGFEKLLQKTKRQLRFKIQCLKNDSPNAFAYPGGRVFLTSDLLEKVKSPVGLAFVIGHELGHHEKRHVLKRLGRVFSMQAIMSLMGLGKIEGANFFSRFGELSFSRDNELEADDFGVAMVSKHFDHYEGVTDFFDYVSTLDASKASDSKLGNIFSTHPVTKLRIHRVKKALNMAIGE